MAGDSMQKQMGELMSRLRTLLDLVVLNVCVDLLNAIAHGNADYDLLHTEKGFELKIRDVLSESEGQDGEGLR